MSTPMHLMLRLHSAQARFHTRLIGPAKYYKGSLKDAKSDSLEQGNVPEQTHQLIQG